jgi:site-specific recombinase XerD
MPRLPDAWKVQTFTDEEIAALFAACDRMGDNPAIRQRNRCILALLFDSGMRASELLGLTMNDVNTTDGVFTVRGKGGKVRPVVIGGFARRELWAYLTKYRRHKGVEEPALLLSQLGTPLTYAGLRQLFRRLQKLTGITRVQVKAHTCRHTFATKAHRNGMRGATLQEMLGHTKFDTTRRYYLDVSTEDLAAEHALYGPLDNMAGDLRGRSTHLRAREVASQLPDAKTLEREVQASSYRAVARKYGTTDTTIRNHIRKGK